MAAMDWMVDALLGAALGVALWLRPWRMLPPEGPPWPWLAWCAMLPLLWSADRLAHSALVQPLPGACLLVLMAGWPLAVLGMAAAALGAAALGLLGWDEAAQRALWLGLLPATLTVGFGAAARRWLPGHLMVYILVRGFFATLAADSLAGALALAVNGGPVGLGRDALLLGRWLTAWGDAIITGMLTAVFVAFRPGWLATYSDRLYLPR